MEKPFVRRSLSASLGSWCISLVHNPRRDVHHTDSRASLGTILFPAYLASFIGVAAACFALSHFITAGDLAKYLSVLLISSAFSAYGSLCAPVEKQKWFRGARWAVGIVLVLMLLTAKSSNIIPTDNDNATNTYVAVFVGFVTILSFLLIGAKSGGRIVSPCAPLVPCLSLFGLLCLISVDSVVQICFLIFLFSSLYLLSYDRYLRRVCPEMSLGVVGALPTSPWPNRVGVRRWASQSMVIAGAWFISFFAGGMMLYMPVQAILPGLIAQPISKMRSAAQNLRLNYSGSSSVMEVTGGNYALSDREVMRVTIQDGQPSGLWRGRTYEYYDRSRWEEDAPSMNPWGTVGLTTDPDIWGNFSSSETHKKNRFSNQRRSINERQAASSYLKKLQQLPPRKGRVRNVLEMFEPIDSHLNTFYASGEMASWSERPDMAKDVDSGDAKTPYLIRSYYIDPRLPTLIESPGYEKTSENGFVPPMLRDSLQRPSDRETQSTMAALAGQINLANKFALNTPYKKADAINRYLSNNCFYSLNSPKVPPTKDAVVFFLTESHAGACDMFASSMVLLLREMNVPARMVSGFIQNDDYSSTVEQRDTYVVRERDAHAWVEYYVPDYGWLSYDPTQGSRNLDATIPNKISQLFDVPGFSVPPLLLFLPVVGLGLVLVGLRGGNNGKSHIPHISQQPDLQWLIFDSYEKARQTLGKKVPFERHYTPADYEARVSRAAIPVEVKQEFAALTHLYLIAKYGQTPDVSSEHIKASLKRLRYAFKHSKRRH